MLLSYHRRYCGDQKIHFFLFLFLSVYRLQGENSVFPPLFVSLGSHCEVGTMLRINGLRKAAYPFDIVASANNDLVALMLEEDFSNFLQEKNLVRHRVNRAILVDQYYDIEFRHDWIDHDFWNNFDSYKNELLEVQAKYQRRINRFRQLDLYEGHIFFIRAPFDCVLDPSIYWFTKEQKQINYDQALTLRDALRTRFPNCNFTLVIINYAEENTKDISALEQVVGFKIRKSNREEDYQKMFKILQNKYLDGVLFDK